MTAPNDTRAAGNQSGDAPTAAPSTITFDARDRLAGRLDDTTVRQAAEDTTLDGETPTPNGRRTGKEALQ